MSENESKQDRIAYLNKMKELRTDVTKADWRDDKQMQGMGYTYLSIDKIKKQMVPLFLKHGLDLDVNVIEVTNLPELKSFPSHMKAKVQFDITDMDTGYTNTTIVEGEGADQGDKALSKALTAANKQFYTLKFQIADGLDPDAPASTFQNRTADQIEEIKSRIANGAVKAPMLQNPKTPSPPAPGPNTPAKAPTDAPKGNASAPASASASKFIPSDSQKKAIDRALEIQREKLDNRSITQEVMDSILAEYNAISSAVDATAFVKKYRT